MGGFKPLYHVESREQFDELKKGWEAFLNDYSFKLDNAAMNRGLIDVQRDKILGAITLSPKEGKIEKIIMVGDQNASAIFFETSPDSIRIKIGNEWYQVRYTPYSD